MASHWCLLVLVRAFSRSEASARLGLRRQTARPTPPATQGSPERLDRLEAGLEAVEATAGMATGLATPATPRQGSILASFLSQGLRFLMVFGLGTARKGCPGRVWSTS